jgi:hypothetical protein
MVPQGSVQLVADQWCVQTSGEFKLVLLSLPSRGTNGQSLEGDLLPAEGKNAGIKAGAMVTR